MVHNEWYGQPGVFLIVKQPHPTKHISNYLQHIFINMHETMQSGNSSAYCSSNNGSNIIQDIFDSLFQIYILIRESQAHLKGSPYSCKNPVSLETVSVFHFKYFSNAHNLLLTRHMLFLLQFYGL